MSSHILKTPEQDQFGFNMIQIESPIALNILQIGAPGSPGMPGRNIEFQVAGTLLQQRLTGDLTWNTIFDLATLSTTGVDGREIELSADSTNLLWRYVGDTIWNILIPLATITGPQGVQGVAGATGSPGTNGTNGVDGKQVELRANATHIQWKYTVDTVWIDLVALSTLGGGSGGTNGREVELQSNGTFIQWRYVGDVSWINLVSLASLTGPQGIQGIQGVQGVQGNPGAAATVSIGTVTTGAAGSNASVTNVGTGNAAILNITIPRGDTGNTGAAGANGSAATITLGTVSTGAAGSSVSITNSGTSSAAVFNFTIPRGDTGLQGIQGIQGVAGTDGTDGVGIASASYNNTNGILTLNFTDSSTFQTTDIRGTNGTNGTDGREVELQTSGNMLQWRYVGDTTWLNLFDFSSLSGGGSGTVLATKTAFLAAAGASTLQIDKIYRTTDTQQIYYANSTSSYKSLDDTLDSAAQLVTPPDGIVQLGAFTRANFGLPSFRNSNGWEMPVQPLLSDCNLRYYKSNPGAATFNTVGMGAFNATGTLTARVPSMATFVGRVGRTGIVSAATAGALIDHRPSAAFITLGTGTLGVGGFFVRMKIVPSSAPITGSRSFYGVGPSSGFTNVDPATLINSVGLVEIDSSTTFKMLCSGTTPQALVDLGTNFPATRNALDVYELTLYAPSSVTNTVYWRVLRSNTGQLAEGTFTGTQGVDLPDPTIPLTTKVGRTNNTTAAAIAIDVAEVYIMTEN